MSERIDSETLGNPVYPGGRQLPTSLAMPPADPYSGLAADFYDYYCPPPPSREEITRDHTRLLHSAPTRISPDNNLETQPAKNRLTETINKLLQNSSDVEGTGPNGEKITIRKGLVTFVEITVSEDMGKHHFGSCRTESLIRHVSAEIVTKFDIDEEGNIENTSASFKSSHCSLHSDQVDTLETQMPVRIDLQNLLDNFQITKQGDPVSRVIKFLRVAVVAATELAPLTNGYYDKLRRKMPPRPPRNPEIHEGF